jgi:type VI protein secretion system component Hcp
MGGHTYIRIDGQYQMLLTGGTMRGGRRWNEILSVGFGGGQPINSSRSSGSLQTAQSVVITRAMDDNSTKLLRTVSQGTNIGTVFVEMTVGAGKKEEVRARFAVKDTVISEYQFSSINNKLAELLTLSFSRIEFLT